jgi:hypothetical protein
VAWLCGLFAIGCAIGAVKNRDDWPMFIFLLCCALLNGAATVGMIATQYEFAWRLAPGIAEPDPGYHHRR